MLASRLWFTKEKRVRVLPSQVLILGRDLPIPARSPGAGSCWVSPTRSAEHPPLPSRNMELGQERRQQVRG